MKIAAFETAGEWCSVALWLDGEVRAIEARAGQRHGELVLPMLDELLAGARLAVRDLEAVAYGAGPGSFTGLRIACGVAQGLAFARGLPACGIPTLEALAEESGAPRVVACLDARMGEVYLAAYRRAGDDWHAAIEPCLCDPAAAPALDGGDWVGCGSGFERYPEQLAQRFGGALGEIRHGLFPHAREIARLGARRLAAGRGVAAEHAAPLYIRDKVALKMGDQR